MIDLFSDSARRDPYPLYDQLRASGAIDVPPPFDATLVLDYQGVARVLSDHAAFSSRVPAPPNWFLFSDPPAHTQLRGLVSRAFTPRMVAGLEPVVRELSRELLDAALERREVDLAADYAVPLPMRVIARMIGIPEEDWPVFKRWSDDILRLSHARSGGGEAAEALSAFRQATTEMGVYLAAMVQERKGKPRDDLLTRLMDAELEGQRLTHAEILGFFQLLVVGGQETTANLINNAILCLTDHREQEQLLRERMELLPGAIEEVLRFRSPLQWVMRTPTREVELHGRVLRPGRLVLAVIGSANRDPLAFDMPQHFRLQREPNPHLAFGVGQHFCMGAALARLEARIALTDLLSRTAAIERIEAARWPPRDALHVHGPSQLRVRMICAC